MRNVPSNTTKQLPTKVTLRHISTSPALEKEIEEGAARLERLARFSRCEVLLEAPHHHHTHGEGSGHAWHAKIELVFPGAEIAVTHEPEADPYLAIRHAFMAAERRVAAFLAKRRTKRRVAGLKASAK